MRDETFVHTMEMEEETGEWLRLSGCEIDWQAVKNKLRSRVGKQSWDSVE